MEGTLMARLDEFRSALPPVTDLDRKPVGSDYSDRIAGMLASTTMPAEHLAGMRNIVTHDGSITPNAAEYLPRTREMLVNTGSSDWQNDDATRRTLVHEVGHHVHFTLNPQQFSSRPEQEAVAENYADQHAPGGTSKYDAITGMGFSPFKGQDHQSDIRQYKSLRQAGTQPYGES